MPKPKKNKKKFIDPNREETVTFDLIHRSQKDPLAADDEAPQRLLLQKHTRPTGMPVPSVGEVGQEEEEVDWEKVKEEQREHGVFYEDDYNYMQHMKDLSKPDYDYSAVDAFLLSKDSRSNAAVDKSSRRPASSLARGDGSVMGASRLQLPKNTLAAGDSDDEEVGLLNLAAPRSGPLLDWDPDIVETLDDAFEGHTEVLTAKQLEKLCAEGGDGEGEADELDELFKEALAEREEEDDEDEYEDVPTDEEEDGEERDFDSDFGGRSEDEEDDVVPDLMDARGHRLFMEEETKSRFTEYSMSSSVIRRNAQLSLLDDKFEEFYAGYDDINVGGLEADEIEGSRNLSASVNARSSQQDQEDIGEHVMSQVLTQYEKDRDTERQQIENQDRLVADAVAASMATEVNPKSSDKQIMEMFEDKPKDRFDCQSILSTYSTLYNHPKLISEVSKKKKIDPIRIDGKTGIPKDVLGRSGLTEGALKRLDRQNMADHQASDSSEGGCGSDGGQTLASRMTALSFRNRHETPEERKARKSGMKEIKRERRAEKKANTKAFKDEQKRQEKVMQANKQNQIKIL